MQTSGSTTTATTYYSVGGQRVAAKVNGTFYYFGYDALGSKVAVFNNDGNLIGSQLYDPYGNQRYINGSLPTSIGFTGQQADTTTGLDYYGARYYDAVTGQFLAADTVQGNAQGMNPYSYVGGNPESRIDPTGQMDKENAEGGGAAAAVGAVGAVGAGLEDADWDGLPGDGGVPPEAVPNEITAQSGDTTYTYDPSTGEVTYNSPTGGGELDPDPKNPDDPAYQKLLSEFDSAAQDGNDSQLTQSDAVDSKTLNEAEADDQQPTGTNTTNDDGNNGGGGNGGTNQGGGQWNPNYENDVKSAVGDSTVGEDNSHAWHGSQPANPAQNGPLDNGWAGPDAIQNYGTPGETWIEAKQVQVGEDVFENSRNWRQLMRYLYYGRPVEYYFSNVPSADTMIILLLLGVGYTIYP